MKHHKTKKLVLSLIKDDLLVTRLASEAAQRGIAASCYNLQLGDAVFALMGIKESAENDALFKWYMCITNEVVKTGIETNPWLLDRLARAIYKKLKQQKAGQFQPRITPGVLQE